MLAFISLLVPPCMMTFLRERLILRHRRSWKKLIEYFLFVLILNLIMIAVVHFLFDSEGNTIIKLVQYSNFALKYLILSSMIAIAEPFAELIIKRKIMIRGGKEVQQSIGILKELKNTFADGRRMVQGQYRAEKTWIKTCISSFGICDWKILKGVFTAAFLAHLFILTNHLVNYDSVWSIYGSEDVITSGRWFLKYAAGVGTYFRMPLVNGFLSILYISLSAVITTKYLEIKNIWLCILAGITLAVYPAVALTFNFMYTADAYFLAMFMAVLAAWLICMEHWTFRMLGGLLAGFSMGIYQAYLSVTLVLLLLWIIKHALIKRESITRHIVGMVVSLIFAAAFYVAALEYRLAGGQLDSYQGIAESTLLHSPEWYVKRILDCFRDIAQTFVSDTFENRYVSIAVTVVWCSTVILLLYYMIDAAKKKQFLSILYGCAGIVLIPIAVYCLKLLSNGVWYYHLMLESIAFVWLLPIIMLDEWLRLTKNKNRGRKIVAFLLVGCVICNLWNYVLVDNISYFASSLANKKTYALAERILDRMEQTEGYERLAYVWFCGNVEKAEYEDIVFQGKSVIGNGIIPNSGENQVGYIRNFLGIRHEIIKDEEVIEKIRKSKEFQNMPVWPSAGCIELIENVMVVKLGEESQ